MNLIDLMLKFMWTAQCYHPSWGFCVLGTGAPADNFNCKVSKARTED